MMFTAAKAITWFYTEPAQGEAESPLLMIARGMAAVETEKLTPCTDFKIAAGVFWGITAQQNLMQLQACLKDGRDVYTNARDGIKLIEKLDEWDVANGLRALANAFDAAPALETDCANSYDDIATLGSWATVFLNPISLVSDVKSNLQAHVAHLTIDAAKAKESLTDAKFFTFGKILGEMIVILTQDPTSEPLLMLQ